MSSAKTESIDVIVRLKAPANIEHPPVATFKELLGNGGFAAVDNSGSTGGTPLQIAKKFVHSLGVDKVSLWNNKCGHPISLRTVRWSSWGGTCPESVFEPVCHVPNNTSSFVFMTDGHISNTQALAQHATITAHFPSLFIIFRAKGNVKNVPIENYNVSVLMAHFSAARTAAVLVVETLDSTARLISVKGKWQEHLPAAPELSPGLMIDQCPVIEVSQLHNLPAEVHSPMKDGTIALYGNRALDLEALLHLNDPRELLSTVSRSNLEDAARAYFASGRLGEWRARLSQWLTELNQEAAAQVQAAAQDSANSAHSLLLRIRLATNDSERTVLKTMLQGAMSKAATNKETTAEVANRLVRDFRAKISSQLEAVAELEVSGMSAMSLGRLSNRARRAKVVNRSSMADISSLDVTGAPEEEDIVMYQRGPVALCLRTMENTDDNTSDFALDQPFLVGQSDQNAVFEPTIVTIQDGMADQIEEMDRSPLSRERLSVCLPIVSLAKTANRKAIMERLCLVFMSELRMPHVWLIVLSSILRTLENEEWAFPGITPTGRLLSWFAREIMEHVTIPVGSRFAPDRSVPIGKALAAFYQTEALTIHSSLAEASVILRLLRQLGASSSHISEESLRCAMLARIATAVPQGHRNWLQRHSADPWADQGPTSLSGLMVSIYDTRVSETGRHVPIAGTGKPVDSLLNLLTPRNLEALAIFAKSMGVPLETFITPGLTFVVIATIERVTNASISASKAVQLARAADFVAAEMDATTAGIPATWEQALSAVRRRLAWARVAPSPSSPFTTPLGPSTLFFYTSDGSVVNMADGFKTVEGEARSAMVLRLTEHVRVVRGQLMQRYYGTSITGSLKDGTIAAPVHRAIVDECREGSWKDVDLNDEEQASLFVHSVVQRVVSRRGLSGNLHLEDMERLATSLLPSLLVARQVFPDIDPKSEDIVPLCRRVTLELGERSPDALGDPPQAVWTPRGDVELERILERVQRQQMAARANALLRRKNPSLSGISNVLIASTTTGLGQRVPNMRKVSRRLTWYLRHKAITRPDGYVPMEVIIPAMEDNRVNTETILRIVAEDTKGRFDVTEDNDGKIWVRANQGHSVTTVDTEQLLTPIKNSHDVPICLHGTYLHALTNIVRSGALSRMQRHAIQMATGLPDDLKVRSGIRPSVDLVIYIDVARAMEKHGLPFYRSSNNVICCPGPIPLDCFLKVLQLRDGSIIHVADFQAQIEAGKLHTR